MKKILIVMAFLLMSVASFAQIKRDTLPTPYPAYGMFSNVSVGVDGGITYNHIGDSNFHGCGFDIYFERPLSYVFDVRLSLGVRENDKFNSMYIPVTGAVKLNWIDLFERVKRTHRFNVYSIAGLGFAVNVRGTYFDSGRLGYDGFAGLGLGYTFGKNYRFKVNLESKVNGVGDFGRWSNKNMYQYTTIGIQYNLGLTKVDKMRTEMIAMLLAEQEETITAKETMLKNCDEDLDSCRKEVERLEKILINHTCCREKFDSIILVKDSTINNLDSILNSIRDNQLTTYALPFSVMFDCNSYTINESEYNKLNQVAKFMKDDGGKFKIVGFASTDGSDAYNLKLSQRRVDAVLRYLKRKGVNGDNLEVDAKGEGIIFGDGKNELNRRVSFFKNF